MLSDVIKEVLISEKEIEQKSIELGQQITNDYKNKDLLVLGLLKGCIPFLVELTKNIDLPIEMAYMVVSSYHGGMTSSLEVQVKYDLESSVKDRNVLLVEDIVDTGNTINTVINMLKIRGAKSVKVVTLLDKPKGRLKSFVPDYIGFKIPDEFVVGFGLDYEELYRNLPYVGTLKPEVYTKINKERD